MPMSDCIVVGVGNLDRGDDAIGWVVAQRLKTRRVPGMRVIEHSGEAAGLVDCLAGAAAAYLIDASSNGKRPGTISRFDVATQQLAPVAFSGSTHGLGLADAIELLRALGRLPSRCVIYTIEGGRFDVGGGLSPEVGAAAEKVANLIRDEMRCHDMGSPACMKPP